jgi:predicted amidophosphoribosyltransferase
MKLPDGTCSRCGENHNPEPGQDPYDGFYCAECDEHLNDCSCEHHSSEMLDADNAELGEKEY